MGITMLIIKKNGRDLSREIWLPIISRIFPRITHPMAATSHRVEEDIEMQVCTLIEFTKNQPIAKLPTHVRFQDPDTTEHLVNPTARSEESIDSIILTETNVTQQIVSLNTVNMKLQEPNNKLYLKNIKEKIETEPGMPPELQSVTKGKGKGKGKSNFKKEKNLRQKYLSDDKSEGIKQEPICKEEDKKLLRSALVSK